eukprot:48654-Eustigmatos_ZCMA.PRE.1
MNVRPYSPVFVGLRMCAEIELCGDGGVGRGGFRARGGKRVRVVVMTRTKHGGDEREEGVIWGLPP